MTPTLQEMGDNTFLAKVDALMEDLERKIGEDSVGGWAVSSIQAEIRRRVLERSTSAEDSFPWSTLTVEIEKLNLSVVVNAHVYGGAFHGRPYLITTTGNSPAVVKDDISPQRSAGKTKVQMHGFFSTAEAEAFLLGLETAKEFGFPIPRVPGIDDADREYPLM